MFGLFKKKSEKEKLTKLYKKIKEQAYILSKTDRRESDRLEKEASDILEKLDVIDKNNASLNK
ncbi:MAG: Uncharacterised protein [Cryomorphaceae bacterium]|nr:MAG: Uncharacterised protein [Cryomorphaceae bacterium]|tara:strand:- start:2929 stop:3117 length:189 start_codon:yes stop_codon:yes gene_type:complete